MPFYFKKVGIAVMIAAIIPAVLLKSLNVLIVPWQKELLRLCTLNAFILGLLFIVIARDKVEDEMTIFIRQKAMASTFIWTVFYVIIAPLIDLLFKYPVTNLTVQKLVLSMLMYYLVLYYILKRRQ